jgi:drug/metabolite transporter (DMT)-like permease
LTSTNKKAHVAALAANLIFATNFSTVKIITPKFIQPLGLNVIRVVVSALLFWILYLMKPSVATFRKKDLGRFVLCAATGVAINQIMFIKGISLTTPIHGALLMLASPIFITFIAAWLLKESLSVSKIIGLIIGVGGAIFLISMKESSGAGSNILFGDLLIMTNAISYAFYMVLVRPLMKDYSPVHVLRWLFTIGVFMIVPFGWNQFTQVQWQTIPFDGWLSLIFVVIGATFFAYLFTIYSINHIGASLTGAYIYTQPVFATVIAVIFLDEHFSWQKALAGALIFLGVFLVNQKAELSQ